VDNTHKFIHPKHILQVTNMTTSQKEKTELLDFLDKGLHSQENTLTIKCLVILHACIRKYFDEDICDMVMGYEGANTEEDDGLKTASKEMRDYVRKSVIGAYVNYLKKLCTSN
jgi:hypothetical protein